MAAAIGMPEAEFWTTTPRYFYLRIERWDINRRDAWEQARMVSYWVVKTVDSQKKFRSYRDLIPFPWDEKAERFEQLTPEDYERISDDADAVLAKVNPELYAKIMSEKQKAHANDSGT